MRESLHAFSIISSRYVHVPIWRTHRKYRKEMKRGYSKILYHQRNKDETIISVIKRLFGEQITSRLIRTQNRELSFRCIAYNIHRLTNVVIIVMYIAMLTQIKAKAVTRRKEKSLSTLLSHWCSHVTLKDYTIYRCVSKMVLYLCWIKPYAYYAIVHDFRTDWYTCDNPIFQTC